MPLDRYFKGKGETVMRRMKRKYGASEGESIFYATVNKMKKAKKGKKPVGGKNPFFGNKLPFQLGDGKRWFKDSRDMGEMSMKPKKGK